MEYISYKLPKEFILLGQSVKKSLLSSGEFARENKVLVEVGSSYKYMDIISKEIKISIFYNVKHATSILKEEDLVQLDGFAREVRVIKENETAL